MADKAITGLTEDTSPTSDDLTVLVNDASGTPANKKATLTNVIKKAHGLSDGMIKVASSTMAVATAGTDYTSPSSTETMTNKTLTAPIISTISNTGTLTLPTSTDTLVGRATTDTLTNKTLTTPIISSISNTGTLTLPTSTDTLVGRDTTDTLTNKSISGGQITSAVANATAATTATTATTATGANALYSATTTVNVSSATAPTTGQYLRATGASTATWQTLSAAKQSYEAVVAAADGDYTTISAAVTAGARSIFVRNGSYSEPTSFTISAANTIIVGESIEGTVVTLSSGQTMTMSGASQVLANIKISVSGAGTALDTSGDYFVANRVHLLGTQGTSKPLASTGNYSSFGQCIIENTANSSSNLINFTVGVQQRVVNCRLKANSNNSSGAINITAADFVLTGNEIDINNGNSSAGYAMMVSGNGTVVCSGNVFRSNQTANQIAIAYYGTTGNITGNSFYGWATTIEDNGAATIIGENVGVPSILRKDFVYMKNTSAATINAGNVVTLKAVAAGNEVTTTTTASDNLVYGVASAAILNNASGFIQVSGKTTLLTVNGTTDIAVGDFITTFTTVGIGAKAAAGNLAIAIALEAYTANDSSGVIDALIIEPRRL